MAIVSIATLKGYFNTGDTPTESQYVDLIDTLAALPNTGFATGWNNLSHADGLTVKAVFFGSAAAATLVKDATGEYTVSFPGTKPYALVIAGDAGVLTGGGQLTINIANSDNYLVWSTRKFIRADTFEVISDPREEMAITETETVSAGATEQVFTNMNNFPAEGFILVQSLAHYSLADTV